MNVDGGLSAEAVEVALEQGASRTHLTYFGQLMRPHLEQIAKNAKQAATTANSFLKLDDAPLRLGVMCTAGPTRCIGLLAQFNQEHPGVNVTLSEGVPAALTESLMAGDLDIAIMAKPTEKDERLRIEPIYRERFVVAFPGHRFVRMNAVKTNDCGGESGGAAAPNELGPCRGRFWDSCGAPCLSWAYISVLYAPFRKASEAGRHSPRDRLGRALTEPSHD